MTPTEQLVRLNESGGVLDQQLCADRALLGAHITARGGGRCRHSTHAASRSGLSLWGHEWKLSLDIQISAVLLRAHSVLCLVPGRAHPESLRPLPGSQISPTPSAVKVPSYPCLQLKDLAGSLHIVGHQKTHTKCASKHTSQTVAPLPENSSKPGRMGGLSLATTPQPGENRRTLEEAYTKSRRKRGLFTVGLGYGWACVWSCWAMGGGSSLENAESL